MPVNMTVRLRGVHKRVGVRRVVSPHTFGDAEWKTKNVASARFGLALAWQSAHSFLRLRAWHTAPGGHAEEFEDGDRLLDVYAGLDIPVDLPPNTFTDFRWISAVVDRAAQVKLLFCIDTDSREFLDACRALPEGQKTMKVVVATQVFDANAQEPQGKIVLELEPCGDAPKATGYLSLDLGNNASTLAHHAGGSLSSRNVRVIDGEADLGFEDPETRKPRGALDNSAFSAVRIDVVDMDAEAKLDDAYKPLFLQVPGLVSWKIGELALAGRGTDGLVLGSKRMAAGRDADGSIDVPVWKRRGLPYSAPRDAMPLPRRLPAELLVCRLLQRLREEHGVQPADRGLAVTYPSTYSRREVDQLAEVVRRALVRQNGMPQDPTRLSAAGGMIGAMLDEASAAAFYFLFREIVETPPGMNRFRSLYRTGFNLLLFDCGGGTTDVGLVRASTAPASPDTLDVALTGRSGVRTFGGDDITVAVFRLLKAAIAAKVQEARAGDTTVRLGKDAAANAKALDAGAADIDAAVPTKYDAARMNSQDRRHRDYTRQLWRRATAVKHALEDESKADAAAFAEDEMFDDALMQRLVSDTPVEKQPELRAGLWEIRVRRADVDHLIRPQVERAARCCNKLILNKLTPDGAAEPDRVHRFVLMGNGSRYPLVRQVLRERLNIPYYDDLVKYEKETLKTAVAMGAALALGVKQAGADLRVHFDWSLCDRLPYDVGYKLVARGLPAKLYDEGTPYEKVEASPKTIRIPPPEREKAEKSRRVYLLRRWPGDDEYEDYLVYDFGSGIDGDITIEYDKAKEFRLKDGAQKQGAQSEAGSGDEYLHPVERGTL